MPRILRLRLAQAAAEGDRSCFLVVAALGMLTQLANFGVLGAVVHWWWPGMKDGRPVALLLTALGHKAHSSFSSSPFSPDIIFHVSCFWGCHLH